jgi:hypothetical protein
MNAKIKKEKIELQRSCYELKTKSEDLEKRYFESQIQLKRMADKAGRQLADMASK